MTKTERRIYGSAELIPDDGDKLLTTFVTYYRFCREACGYSHKQFIDEASQGDREWQRLAMIAFASVLRARADY